MVQLIHLFQVSDQLIKIGDVQGILFQEFKIKYVKTLTIKLVTARCIRPGRLINFIKELVVASNYLSVNNMSHHKERGEPHNYYLEFTFLVLTSNVSARSYEFNLYESLIFWLLT